MNFNFSRGTDGRIRIWHQQCKSMDPSCLLSAVQADGGGVIVWGMFSWHTLGSLIQINCLPLSIWIPLLTSCLPSWPQFSTSSNGFFPHYDAPCHKAIVISNWFHSMTMSAVLFRDLPGHWTWMQEEVYLPLYSPSNSYWKMIIFQSKLSPQEDPVLNWSWPTLDLTLTSHAHEHVLDSTKGGLE